MNENMTQFKTEGQPAFPVANTENDNSAHSSGDSKETNANLTGSSDQNQNQTQQNGGEGSRDPESGLNNPPVERWQQREAEWKDRFNTQETRHTDEMKKFHDGMNANIATAVSEALKKAGVQADAADANIPDWFGSDDSKLWSSYQSHTEKIVARAVEQALSQFTQRSTQEQKQIDDATTWMNSEIAAIESDKELNPNGLKVDRNKLLKTAFDNKSVDLEGRWNYRLAFKLMKPEEVFQAKAALNERKNIASATTDNARADSKQPNVATSQDFKNPSNRPW